MNRRHFGACGAVISGFAALLVSSASAQVMPASPPAVTTYRFDTGRSGYTDGKVVMPLTLAWKRTTAPIHNTTASFTYQNGIVYIAGDRVIYGFKASTGEEIWRFPADATASAPFYNTPVIDSGALYIGGDDKRVYKLDLATGKQIWVKTVTSAVRGPVTVAQGNVIVGCVDGTVIALGVADGKQVWSQTTGGPISTAGAEDGNGNIVYAGSDNSVSSFDELSGRLMWSIMLPTDATASPPAFTGDTFLAGAGRVLYALTSRRGSTRWSSRFDDDIVTPVAISSAADMIYLSTAPGIAYGLSDRGQIVWSTTLPTPTSTPPTVVGNTVFFCSEGGCISAYDAIKGTLLWQYVAQRVSLNNADQMPFTDIAAAPVWADNTLFVMSDDGTISAFHSNGADDLSPLISHVSPMPGSTVNGKGINFYASIVDEGCGIKPDSVSLSIDGQPVASARYVATSNGVDVLTPANSTQSGVPDLTEGSHKMTIAASDWAGNSTSKTYGFVVDNSVNQRGTAPTRYRRRQGPNFPPPFFRGPANPAAPGWGPQQNNPGDAGGG